MTETPQKVSTEEFMESLTGFEEIAIAKAFDKEVFALAQSSPTTFIRALVFVAKKRDGLNDAQAKETVLGMSLRDVNDFFAQEEEEFEPDQPVTEAGKDELLPA